MKILPLLMALLALVGCGRPSGEHADGDGETRTEAGVTFSEKRGVQVPAETAAHIGLKVEDVEERVVKAEFRFSAQVYRAISNTQIASTEPIAPTIALASGDVSPEDVGLVHAGKPITVTLDSGGALSGRITEIHAHTNNSAEHYDVTVSIDDPDAKLRAGSFITIKTAIGSGTPVISVPRAALIQTTEGRFVYTASGEHFVRTAVKTGVMNEQFAEITDGLYAGDKVVTSGATTLWMAELQAIRGGKACADGD